MTLGAPDAPPAPVAECDLLPLSALQHFVYCERQAALIHVEQVWLENVWTVEGSHLHEKVISGEAESRRDVRVARDVPIRSRALGVTGRADVVEFHRLPDGDSAGAMIKGWPGCWRPHPVEYKRGRPKRHRADDVQLCAQAICFEEMLGVPVPDGSLFYGMTRHREAVVLHPDLRSMTEAAARRFREMFESRRTPPAVYERCKCEGCSLLEICRPRVPDRRVDRYLASILETSSRRSGP